MQNQYVYVRQLASAIITRKIKIFFSVFCLFFVSSDILTIASWPVNMCDKEEIVTIQRLRKLA